MSQRGFFWLQVSLGLYGLMLLAYGYAVYYNLDRVRLPELVRAGVRLPGPEDAGRDARIDQLAEAGYYTAEAVGGVAEGALLDEAALSALTAEGVPVLAVYDPAHVRRLADQELRAGRSYRVGDRLLVEVGDPLDEPTLMRLALPAHRSRVVDPSGRIFVEGHTRLWGSDLTFLFVWLNLLALTGILYALLFEPLRRVMRDRSARIAEQFQAGEQYQEELALLHRDLTDRLAELQEATRTLQEAGDHVRTPQTVAALRACLRAFLTQSELHMDTSLLRARHGAQHLLATLDALPDRASGIELALGQGRDGERGAESGERRTGDAERGTAN